MTTNPWHNALLAIAYIIGIVLLLSFAPAFVGSPEDTIFIPMAMLALLVLSVAVMGYLFFYRPMLLILDGRREEGVKLFLHTLGIFAGATALVLLVSIAASWL